MIYKVGILGATGRMGTELCNLLGSGLDFLGDWFEIADLVSQQKKISTIDSVPVRTLKEPPREPVHVWIDFSGPLATLELLNQIEVPVVIGTTGFSGTDLEKIRNRSESLPILLAPNTSIGIYLLREMLLCLPQNPNDLSAETSIVEEHHSQKKDAPSGTANALAQMLASRGYDDVPIHSIRGGDILGTHTVKIFIGKEELTLTHRVYDRKVFAEGALRAARYLVRKPPGLYSMEDVFGETK